MSDPCQSLVNQIASVRGQLAAASSQEVSEMGGHSNLGPAPAGTGKGAQIGVITEPSKQLDAKLTALQAQLVQCREQHGGLPDLKEDAIKGTVAVSVSGGAPVEQPVSFSVTFNQWHHTTWEIDIDPTATFTTFMFDGNTIGVQLSQQAGSFNRTTGAISLGLGVSLATPSGAGPASFNIVLSSSNEGGSPMSKTGDHRAVLTGSSTIKESGGFVNPANGDSIDITLSFGVAQFP